MCKKLLVLSAVIFLINVNITYAENQKVVRPSERSLKPSYLPGVVIACQMLQWFRTIRCLQSTPPGPVIELSNNVENLSPDIRDKMSWAHLVFTVQNNIGESRSGFVRIEGRTLEESNVPPFENILFVTTPIESFGNRVLVFVGSESPEDTTIFSVDETLNVELLFESNRKKTIRNIEQIKSIKGIFSIYGIEVVKPGYFLLQERAHVSGDKIFSPYKNRVFVVDVTRGAFEMTLDLSSEQEALIEPSVWP